ncbi:MAG TPA: hypothetical protein VK973_06990 [Arenicellales bacterium]|nr:hypothetical protein [Arenicellales bacterium]
MLVAFRTDGAEWQTTLMLTTTGRIEARRGDNTGTVLATSDSVVTADAYTHFECRVACDDTNGAVEVRINGVTVLNISGVDTQAAATNAMAEAWVGNWGGSPNADRYIDDMFCWDTNGSQNNDFIGDRRVLTLFPDQDTAEADWAVEDGASPPGSGYEAINDETPDDDTSYIYTDQVGDVSEFGLQDTPEGISAISAIVAVNRMRKDDAGDCNVQCSLVSQGSPIAEANGADRPITEVYTYWQDVFELDPSTAAPWTPESFDAALLKFERTS